MSTTENISEEISEQFNSIVDIFKSFYSSYKEKNSWKLRLVDSFMIYVFIILCLQIGYMLLVGNFPKNSFLSGVICCVGTMALTACMRVSISNNKQNKQGIYIEFLFASLIFYLTIVNFMG